MKIKTMNEKIESPYTDDNIPDIEDTIITTNQVFGKAVKGMRYKRKEIADRLKDTNKLADEVVKENERDSHMNKKVEEAKKLHLNEYFENDFLNEDLIDRMNRHAKKGNFTMVEKIINEIQDEIDNNENLDDMDKSYYSDIVNYGKDLLNKEESLNESNKIISDDYYVEYEDDDYRLFDNYRDAINNAKANGARRVVLKKNVFDEYGNIIDDDNGEVIWENNTVVEDTVKKRNGKWTNRGDEGEEHGEFRTKKAADAQRKAMFANGYKAESKKVLKEAAIRIWGKLPTGVKHRMDDAWSGPRNTLLKTRDDWDIYLTALVDCGIISEDEYDEFHRSNVEDGFYESFKNNSKESLTESTMSQINAIATHYNTQDSTSAVKDVLLRIAGLTRNGIDSIDRLAHEFDINESIEDKTIDEVEEFIDEVKERFPGSEAIFDGDTKTIKITLDDEVKENLKEELEESPVQPGSDVGFANMIGNLIIDEYETIDAYNSALVAAQEEGNDDAIAVLSDIQAEENVHVGQLQKLMQLFDKNAIKVDQGNKEAEEQIDTANDNEIETETEIAIDDSVE